MPQARRKAVAPAPPRETVRLSPVPGPSTPGPEDQSRELLKSLEKISKNGGTFSANRPPRRYAFPGGTHLNISQEVHENLWRFELSPMARNLLDHFVATHDQDGVVAATQQSLGAYFGCHHSKISRAIKVLDGHNFAWKARQGRYQLNPTYAYRWGSRKHHALTAKLKKTLKGIRGLEINPPLNERTSR